MRTHVATSGFLPLPLPTTTAGSHPRGLRPRWHAKEQDVSQRPDLIGQPSGHRWRVRLPRLRRAHAMGGHRLRQGLAYARMREAKIVVDMVQNELLPHTVLT